MRGKISHSGKWRGAFCWLVLVALAALACLPAAASPSTTSDVSWTAPPARLKAEAGWYYQDGKRRERLGDLVGAAADYKLALTLLPKSKTCQQALSRVRKKDLTTTTTQGFVRLTTTQAASPYITERALFSTLNRALYGSSGDRARAHAEFIRVLGQDDVRVVWRAYPVRGTDAPQIWDSMQKTSSVLTDSPDVGITKWDYEWKAVPGTDSHGRQVFNAVLSSRIIITMPQWKSSRSDSQDLAARWQEFYTALTYHEQGHQLIAEFTLAALRLRINQNSRRSFPEPISVVCNQVIQDYAQLNDQYDQATQHGALQGAVFRY